MRLSTAWPASWAWKRLNSWRQCWRPSRIGRFERMTLVHDFHWNAAGNTVAAEVIAAEDSAFTFSGAEGDRTRYLLVANQSLSQMSYGPKNSVLQILTSRS